LLCLASKAWLVNARCVRGGGRAQHDASTPCAENGRIALTRVVCPPPVRRDSEDLGGQPPPPSRQRLSGVQKGQADLRLPIHGMPCRIDPRPRGRLPCSASTPDPRLPVRPRWRRKELRTALSTSIGDHPCVGQFEFERRAGSGSAARRGAFRPAASGRQWVGRQWPSSIASVSA